jgi:hypothetical protein
MAKDCRSPCPDKVDVLPAINVGDCASLGLIDEEGLASEATEGTDGGIYPAYKALLGTLPELVGNWAGEVRIQGING